MPIRSKTQIIHTNKCTAPMGRNNKQQIRAAVSASLLQHTSAILNFQSLKFFTFDCHILILVTFHGNTTYCDIGNFKMLAAHHLGFSRLDLHYCNCLRCCIFIRNFANNE